MNFACHIQTQQGIIFDIYSEIYDITKTLGANRPPSGSVYGNRYMLHVQFLIANVQGAHYTRIT